MHTKIQKYNIRIGGRDLVDITGVDKIHPFIHFEKKVPLEFTVHAIILHPEVN